MRIDERQPQRSTHVAIELNTKTAGGQPSCTWLGLGLGSGLGLGLGLGFGFGFGLGLG